MKRRTLLKSMVAPVIIGASATLLHSRLPAAATHTLLDPNNPDDLYVIHRKLNYRFDNGLVFWYIQAVRNGLVDSEFTPFWKMDVGFIASVRDLDDRRYEVKTMSAIFYTDLETGKLIDSFDNPYTGQKIPVRQPTLSVSARAHNKTGLEARPPRPGVDMKEYGDIGPAWVIGDDVWCQADTGFRIEANDERPQPTQVNDWFTYHGSISEVSNPDVQSAQATQNFNDINTWPAWLNMGDHPGNYVSRGFGRKVASMSAMPESWQKLMKEQYPKEFADPQSRIDG
ncbi:MAG: DUF1838 family protein [Rhodospirillaceae bacterium]